MPHNHPASVPTSLTLRVLEHREDVISRGIQRLYRFPGKPPLLPFTVSPPITPILLSLWGQPFHMSLVFDEGGFIVHPDAIPAYELFYDSLTIQTFTFLRHALENHIDFLCNLHSRLVRI